MDGKRLLEKRVEQEAAARVECCKRSRSPLGSCPRTRARHRHHLQAELRQPEEANPLPSSAASERRRSSFEACPGKPRRKLEQELTARPSEHDKQRLFRLDVENEQLELEPARLRRG